MTTFSTHTLSDVQSHPSHHLQHTDWIQICNYLLFYLSHPRWGCVRKVCDGFAKTNESRSTTPESERERECPSVMHLNETGQGALDQTAVIIDTLIYMHPGVIRTVEPVFGAHVARGCEKQIDRAGFSRRLLAYAAQWKTNPDTYGSVLLIC